MRTAFKEWAIIVEALGRGEQILILRKGGLREGRDGFQVEHDQFLLFPTLYHQQRQLIVGAAQTVFDAVAAHFPPPDIVRVQFLAEVVAWRRLDARSSAEALRGQHWWSDEVIAQRFDWGHAKNIFALAVRVSRLPLPIELAMAPTYGGCKSWVELDQDIVTAGATPVLDQPTFDRKLNHLLTALNPAASP